MGLGRLADEVFEAVIFDMDGTLIDSTPAVVRAWATWASEYGLAPMDLRTHHGTPSASVVRAVMPEHLHEAAMQRITELETGRPSRHRGPARRGRGAGIPRGRQERDRHLVYRAAGRGADRGRAAGAALGAGDRRRRVARQAAPRTVPEAARRLGVDPRRCLVVEDAPKGLEAAQAAGCFTLAVVTTTPREALDADAIVTDLSEVRFEVGQEGVRLRLAEQFDDALEWLRAEHVSMLNPVRHR